MKSALLIGYFPQEPLLREFYNLLASQIQEFGYSLTGLDLGGRTWEGYRFPIQPAVVAGSRLERFLDRIRARFDQKPHPDFKCYAEMQAQQSDVEAIRRESITLASFRRALMMLCVRSKVKLVFLNHQFSGYHLVAADVCNELGIKKVYWHPGFLPGTMSFDLEGQLAESEINEKLARELNEQRVEDRELGLEYRNWITTEDYLRPGKKTSSDQECLQEIRRIRSNFQKAVLVIGTNDFRAGIQPECYPKANVHSPVFRTSDALFDAVVKNVDGTTLVLYKPHPNVVKRSAGLKATSKNSYQLFDVTIKDLLPEVNASITICSAGAYESMLFDVPTVIAGTLPGSSLGICFSLRGKAAGLKQALDDAFTGRLPAEMADRFTLFVGYLLNKYFFSAGAAACPLVKRSLHMALAEMLQQKGSHNEKDPVSKDVSTRGVQIAKDPKSFAVARDA